MRKLHLACAADAQYVAHSAAMLHSAIAHGGEPIVVHYLHGPRFPRADIGRLAGLFASGDSEIVFHEIPDARLGDLPVADMFGAAMWYRVFLPELLPDAAQVLYLDVDTLVVDRLDPLWELELGNCFLAAVTNVFMEYHRYRARQLGIALPDYFNSGVLMFNLTLMREVGFSGELVELVRGRGTDLLWPDQDALNLLAGSRRLPLHPRWNVMNSFTTRPELAAEAFGAKPLGEALAYPAIRHFEGPGLGKPWHQEHARDWQEIYRAHRAATPWPDVVLEGEPAAEPSSEAHGTVRNALRAPQESATSEQPRYQPERGDVRSPRRSHPLAYIIKELPDRLEDLSRDLNCPDDGRVLDFGCADTPYRGFFPDSVDYLAADIPGNQAATITINADGTVPVGDESIDVVLSTQVLEHVMDPGLYLAECHRVLRPGGRLLLSTHGFMVYHPDPVDFWRWTSAGLREVVSRAGLQVVRFEGIMGLSASGLQFVQDGFLFRVSARLRPAFAYTMQRLIAFVDKHELPDTRQHNALVFGLVAQKPAHGPPAAGI